MVLLFCALFYMSVVADVIFAVAEVAVAPGAIAEFQFRIGGIISAAYSAAMGVGDRYLFAAIPGEGH